MLLSYTFGPSVVRYIDTSAKTSTLQYECIIIINYFNDKKLCFAFHECHALLSVPLVITP